MVQAGELAVLEFELSLVLAVSCTGTLYKPLLKLGKYKAQIISIVHKAHNCLIMVVIM